MLQLQYFPGQTATVFLEVLGIQNSQTFFENVAVNWTTFAGTSDGYHPTNFGFTTQTIMLSNQGSGVVEFSFDGVTVAGQLDPNDVTSSLSFDNLATTAIWFRLKSGSVGTVTIAVQAWSISATGGRANSLTTPIVSRIILPDLTLAVGYPKNMIKIDTGLYYFSFVLPVGAISVGSYLVDMSYTNPVNEVITNTACQIVVNAPYGNWSMTTQ